MTPASTSSAVQTPRPPSSSNRLGLDYRREAARLGPPVVPIIDAHLHIHGAGASKVYDDASRVFGVREVYSQTRPSDADAVKAVLGAKVQFLAVPDWGAPDKTSAFTDGFLTNMRMWRDRYGARCVKFWAAPRLWDIVRDAGGDPMKSVPVDSEWRVKAAELAMDLGMMFMTHVADPDTWFATRYSDGTKYGGTKRDQYKPLERMLDRFPAPWIGAHMGGYPEDLDFLDGMLARHSNYYLDTSATKWVVRELSKHDTSRVREFFQRWKGRILFGSDIVTLEDHIRPPGAKQTPAVDKTERGNREPVGGGGARPAFNPQSAAAAVPAPTPTAINPKSFQADSPEGAFDLYASRYYAQRLLLETDYHGESPIADEDLKMVDPSRYDDMSAPMLKGHALPRDVLESVYARTAEGLLGEWYRGQ